jgi:uncharacterized membrane protein
MIGVASVQRSTASLPRAVSLQAVVLGVVMAVGVGFLLAFAVPHIAPDPSLYARYASRRGWLLLHIGSGAVALLVGPVQLWLGLGRRHLGLHRRLGAIYLGSVAAGSVSAFYLALHTDFGWLFGMGLTGLAVAWLVTTGLALAAIRRRLILQHQEWMIRSYVVTFAFVTFRLVVGALQAADVGTLREQLTAASWFSWAVPLLGAEAMVQGRKIVSREM